MHQPGVEINFPQIIVLSVLKLSKKTGHYLLALDSISSQQLLNTFMTSKCSDLGLIESCGTRDSKPHEVVELYYQILS